MGLADALRTACACAPVHVHAASVAQSSRARPSRAMHHKQHSCHYDSLLADAFNGVFAARRCKHRTVVSCDIERALCTERREAPESAPH